MIKETAKLAWTKELEANLKRCTKKTEFTKLNSIAQINEYLKKHPELLQNLAEKAKSHQRQRFLETLHIMNTDNTSDSLTNAMFNCFLKETYVSPHQHSAKNEYFYGLEGELALIIFDINYLPSELITIRKGDIYKINPGVIHTIVCLTEPAIVLEVKDKPYNPTTDKVFGSIFPAEAYLQEKLVQPAQEFLTNLRSFIHDILY